jgi:transcription initiation factor TFIIE subunit beta
MSSYLEKSQAAFQSNVTSAASKVSKPRSALAPPASAPSPAPSTSSTGDSREQKRKRETQNTPVVYSQPTETGYGTDSFTQVTYIIDFLKKKGDAKTFKEILEYLSQVNTSEQQRRTLAAILRKHGRIQWIPDPKLKSQGWDSGTFVHKPIIAVRSKTDLIAYLQRKDDFQGVSVKDLKDGWPDCEESLTQLEAKNKILVTRTKKDNHARMVWANDPTLIQKVEVEFVRMWYDVKLPDPDDLVRSLIDAGQKPASEDPSKRVKAPAKVKEKKKRPPRKGGRTTNTHMEHLLKDYDHLKR